MQLEFFDVPSPCMGVCQSDEKGNCLGCYRTREERQTWINLTSDNKQKVVKRCLQRKKRKNAKPKVKVIPTQIETQQPSLLDPQSKAKPDPSTDLDFGDFEL
ncbi:MULTISPECIES: DUF1289 domain-containing protein [unclassified Colwellia]|jgi:predicted Fe-S protein YdhL (DUF1289 family)|uniref:DUF1289 domain-containing protein n=1 Tax=unclassified Colwellia TaxID=196834 RepID=UPI0015F47D90|nr:MULTISPECIES: DUF1289 domain-containing protein [unclassified Colwellia]MBA6335641.1 DUF1289 domain-containing protein [Colwellia sp. BRX8-7]MBA6349440.1 DUF1289 domain-containing protein [Colwellia sp. BRX8-9]MBA6357192.1 DUF1289 domain-containing protein [Colwellia sp. BRX8-3]MBA6360710.1 DUF1289 domain-containing protein [Colwellia sp. BRX8-6]MBA6368682.1 DUF1289 domain-containing protein [Colwellia sp. BRX8-5]